MATYRINYNKTINQAEDIKDLARDLNKQIAELETLLARVKNDWKGPASDAFQMQMRKLISQMKATKKDMDEVSSDIKTVAKQIQREDEDRESNSVSVGVVVGTKIR